MAIVNLPWLVNLPPQTYPESHDIKRFNFSLPGGQMEPLTAFTEAAVNEQYCLRWGHAFLPCILRKEEMETWPRQFGDFGMP